MIIILHHFGEFVKQFKEGFLVTTIIELKTETDKILPFSRSLLHFFRSKRHLGVGIHLKN
jgi:hypothetical protein